MGKFSKSFWEEVRFHATILLRGLARTLYGVFTAILFSGAAFGFVFLGTETGYLAVCDFIASFGLLIVAIANVYLTGKRTRR